MKKIETSLPGVFIIEADVHGDHRGYFMETYSAKAFKDMGIDRDFVQDNESFTAKKGTLRGLHFQNDPAAQCKLVRAVSGALLDVAVDLRKGSPTYKQWVSVELSAENKRMLFIPRGFAHGFLVLSDMAEFCYKCDDFYHANDEGGLAWNDPQIGIKWPEVCGDYSGSADASGYTLADGHPLILSEKDQKWLGLKETFRF